MRGKALSQGVDHTIVVAMTEVIALQEMDEITEIGKETETGMTSKVGVARLCGTLGVETITDRVVIVQGHHHQQDIEVERLKIYPYQEGRLGKYQKFR